MPEMNLNYQSTKDFSRIAHKQVNIFNSWEDEIAIVPGQLTEIGGSYAIKSLVGAAQALTTRQFPVFLLTRQD